MRSVPPGDQCKLPLPNSESVRELQTLPRGGTDLTRTHILVARLRKLTVCVTNQRF